jgi:hypothetical protein
LFKYKAAGVEAELRGTSREIERDRLTAECESELPANATPGQRCRLWQRRAVGILLAHPLTYAKVHAEGTLLELVGPERDHTTRLLYGASVLDETGGFTDASIAAVRRERSDPLREIARFAILGWQAVLFLALGAGAWLTARGQPRLFAVLLLLPLYVLALSGGPEASPRFRVLYLPVFAFFSATAIEALLARLTKRGAATVAPPPRTPYVSKSERGRRKAVARPCEADAPASASLQISANLAEK